MRRAGVPYWVSVVLVNTRSLCVWNWSIHLTCCISGPMVYGICFCPVSRKEDLKNSKVAGWLQSNSWVKIRWKSAAFSRMLFRLKDADGGREREPVSEAQWGQRFCRLGSSGPVTKHHFHQHAAEVHDFTACVRRLVITVKELFNPLCFYIQSKIQSERAVTWCCYWSGAVRPGLWGAAQRGTTPVW